MKPICRARLNQERARAGRPALTDAEAAAIESRLTATMRRLARTDPNWRAMSSDQRMLMAAQQAATDIKAEAARKLANAQRQALKTAETEVRLADQMKRLKFSRAQAWADDIQGTHDRASAIAADYTRDMLDTVNAARSGEGAGLARRVAMFAFDADNPAMSRDMALEIYAKADGSTGNEIAKRAAAGWLKVAEGLRQRANAAGFDIGKVSEGYLPHAWDQDKVLAAGADRFAERLLPLVDRGQLLHEDGRPMSDEAVMQFLRAAAETLQSDGANQATPGAFKGSGARANRGSEHRQIHFKSGDAYLEAMREFGSGSMYDAMTTHLRMMARDIALVERYGPNPEAQHRLQVDLAKAESPSGRAPLVALSSLDAHWRAMTGTATATWRYTPPVIGEAMERLSGGRISGEFTGAGAARFWAGVRNVQSAAKLGGILVSSITDIGPYMATLHFNKLSYFDGIANAGRSLTPKARAEMVEFMNAHGLMADTLLSSLNRYTGDHLASGITDKLAAATLRLGLSNWWTEGMQRAYSLTQMQGFARLSGSDWASLDEWTREIVLARRGITPEDWEVIRTTQPTPTPWGSVLTPEGIYATGHPRAQEVVTRYLQVLKHEAQTAVIEADIATRAAPRRGTEAGSLGGEVARSIAQFKAFPAAMITRHWRRLAETPGGLEGAPLGFRSPVLADRLAFSGALVASMTMLGAIVLQARELKEGRDPIAMDSAKFWSRAFAQGGGLGFYGDVLMRDSTADRSPQQGLFELLGPNAGSVAQLYELTKGNIDERLAGKDTHAGAEAVRFVKSHTPLVNLWYTKAALDHAVLGSLQENLSPGYLERIKARARREWGNGYWWEPGEALPGRAPDLSFEQLSGANR